ncbi:MAG: zinc ABC transporter substrate-binding protein [Chloroflexota bacterium]|nr:zinc ABC transporter substrate-binding protein [Chloroflexota bacterium]
MTVRFRHALLLPLALLLTLFPVTSSIPAQAQDGERLRVVATFSILGDVVRNVAGDAADLTVIVGPDGDAHTFEPDPDQIGALADADLIFENGAGFEPWLDDVYEASGASATRVAVTDGLSLLAFGDAEHDEGHEDEDHAADDGHDHGDHDPHAWHDVANVITEVGTIRDALAASDPANAAIYAANADAYIAQLQTLDADIRSLIGTIPAEDRILFTSHDSLAYFAHAYGFAIAGSAFGSISTEAADPSAGEIAALIDEIRAAGVPAIFAENVENSDLMEQIANDAGVELAATLYTDALSAEDGPASTYIALMTYNATTIVTALGGTAG